MSPMLALVFTLICAVLGVPAAASRHIVTATAEGLGAAKAAAASNGCVWIVDIPSINAFAVDCPETGAAGSKAAKASAVSALATHSSVSDIQVDVVRTLTGHRRELKQLTCPVFPADPFFARQSTQSVPYGISMVQANLVRYNASNPKTLCILDSGLDINHPDLCGPASSCKAKINYKTLIRTNRLEDLLDHGTHVTGIAAALNNAIGSVGVSSNGQLPVRFVKVFTDGTTGAYTSDILAGALDCANNGAAVISMSLGGAPPLDLEATFWAKLEAQGVLLIASSGNNGTAGVRNYPAYYPSIISVAAVDSSFKVADFSTHNSDVELSAPGVGVLSTVPVQNSCGVTTPAGRLPCQKSVASPASFSLSGTVVFCNLLDTQTSCNNAIGKICLMRYLGTRPSSSLVSACNAGGGIGALLYTDNDAIVNFVNFDGSALLPSVGISTCNGRKLRAAVTAASVSAQLIVNAPHGYDSFDGTSMAAPHVAAVAAVVWSNAPPGTTAATVRLALGASAKHLGTPGRNQYYGFGLVQAKAALTWIRTNVPLPQLSPPAPPLTIGGGRPGASCVTANDCSSLSCYKSVCECFPTNSVLNGCTLPKICTFSATAANYCALPPGSACKINADCTSRSCVAGVCACSSCRYNFEGCSGGCPSAAKPFCIASPAASAKFCSATP